MKCDGKRVKGRSPLQGLGQRPKVLKGGFEMEIRCYKMLDGRGKVYLPAALREAVGFGRNDVLQLTLWNSCRRSSGRKTNLPQGNGKK